MVGRAERSPTVLLAGLALLAGACLRIGEPTPGTTHVTWAAYPETVQVGKTFSFEFAGPVGETACARLDTAILSVRDSAIRLEARRSTYSTLCSEERVSFYEARPLRLERPGRYQVSTEGGLTLGAIVATDSGPFTAMHTVGEGTVRSIGGCYLFGPGWASNQRPFALLGASPAIKSEAGTDRIVHVQGRLAGFALCDWFGSRPSIRVDTAWVTQRRSSDYF